MALEFLSAPSHADIKIFDDLDNWYDACVLIQKTNPRYLPRFLEKLGMTGTRSQIASCEKMLIFAVRNNQLEVVNILIRHAKLDVNKFDSAGESPLFNAAENGFIEVVNALLTHPRINLNQEKYGKTALYLAAKNKHKDVVESLVKHIIQYSKMNQKDRGLQSQEPCPEVDQWIKILLIYPSLALNSKLFPNKSPFRTTLGDNHQGLAYEQLRENICENINILLAANNQFLNNNGIAHKILKFGPLSFKLYIATCAVFVFYALLTNHGNEQVELGLILAFLALTIGLVQGVAFYQRLPVLKYNYCLPLSDERIQALTKFKESFPILHFINPCISTKLDRLTRFFRSYKKEEFQQQSDAANDIPIKIKSM